MSGVCCGRPRLKFTTLSSLVPDATQRAAVRRRAGTQEAARSAARWAPALQRTVEPDDASHRRGDAALRPGHESGECGPTWFDIVISAATCPPKPLGEGGSNPGIPPRRQSGIVSWQAPLAMTEQGAAAHSRARIWLADILLADTPSHPRGASRPSFASLPCPRLNKGAGKAGSRLAPVDRYARGRLRVLRIAENRATGDIPAFPAQWLERLMSCSPRERCTIAPSP